MLCHDSLGGSTRVATELAFHLAQNGHQIHLFAYTPPLSQWVDTDRITLHTLHKSRPKNLHLSSLHTAWSTAESATFIKMILQVIENKGLDILHFHYALPFARMVAEIRDHLQADAPRTVGTLHGTDVTIHGHQQGAKREQLLKDLHSLNALTTVSLSHAKLAQKTFHLAAMPLVIPNFIDPAHFYPSTPASGTLNIPKIIHVSNFRAVKRILDVAQIFLGIRERMEAELWLVGDGQNMVPAKQFFANNNLINAVHFWGLQPNISSILNQAALLLITSQHESFCLVALEGMACGVPVLATDVGGLPELVVDGETGLLFPVGDCDTAVTLATNLLSDSKRHQAMRKSARTHALTYHFAQIIPQYEALYQQLLPLRRTIAYEPTR